MITLGIDEAVTEGARSADAGRKCCQAHPLCGHVRLSRMPDASCASRLRGKRCRKLGSRQAREARLRTRAGLGTVTRAPADEEMGTTDGDMSLFIKTCVGGAAARSATTANMQIGGGSAFVCALLVSDE